jgi:hypothetical protein
LFGQASFQKKATTDDELRLLETALFLEKANILSVGEAADVTVTYLKINGNLGHHLSQNL